MKNWNELPDYMRIDEVKPYYELLKKRGLSIFFKRLFDIVMSLILILLLAIPMLIIAILIITDSPGGVFYRQERVTKYGRHFRIF